MTANARCLLWQLNKGFFQVSLRSPASSWEKDHILFLQLSCHQRERVRNVNSTKFRGTRILFSTENMALRPTDIPSSISWGHISDGSFSLKRKGGKKNHYNPTTQILAVNLCVCVLLGFIFSTCVYIYQYTCM